MFTLLTLFTFTNCTDVLPKSDCEQGQVEMYDGTCSDDIPKDAIVINASDVNMNQGETEDYGESDPDDGTAEACCIPAQNPYGGIDFLGACWLPQEVPALMWGCYCVGNAVYWDYYYNTWLPIQPLTPIYYTGYTCDVE